MGRLSTMSSVLSHHRRPASIALLVVVAVLLAGAGWWLFARMTTTRITAYFDRTVAIYPGSEVRVLGVKVGKVSSVTPQGRQVQVVLDVDRSVHIPADAHAVQINPSVVSDRYVQLTPVYRGGPIMARTAVIPRDRTATPVEVDELYRSLRQLSDALGPNGANRNGAVSELVTTAAANLAGNGQAINDSITNLSRAARYLSNVRGDLFGTVRNLQVFVSELAANDTAVRTFNSELGRLATFLSDERKDLGSALALLSVALGDVARFIDQNRALVEANANSLTTLTKTLADQRDALARALPEIPLALSNLINIHNGESGTLDMRVDLPDLQNPLAAQCRLFDITKIAPGDHRFDQLAHDMAPMVAACNSLADQLTARIESPTLVLPFGILSGENIQRNPVPGTIPGTPSHRPPASVQFHEGGTDGVSHEGGTDGVSHEGGTDGVSPGRGGVR